jgi:hypothetical protein
MSAKQVSHARPIFSRLRETGMLRVIWAMSLGAGLLIFYQLVLRDRETVFGSGAIFTIIHVVIASVITIAIVREVLHNPKWRSSWRILIVVSVGIAGTLMPLLLILGIFLESAPQIALLSVRTGFACGGIWLLGIFSFLIIRVKIAQDAYRARLNHS